MVENARIKWTLRDNDYTATLFDSTGGILAQDGFKDTPPVNASEPDIYDKVEKRLIQTHKVNPVTLTIDACW